MWKSFHWESATFPLSIWYQKTLTVPRSLFPLFKLSFKTQPLSSIENSLIVFNITAQINEKLTLSSFSQLHAQFETLLIGYDLMDYINDLYQCPSSDETPLSICKKTHWVQQNKFILNTILTSTSPTITPFIAIAKTTHEAWKQLSSMYSSRSCTRAMQLKE